MHYKKKATVTFPWNDPRLRTEGGKRPSGSDCSDSTVSQKNSVPVNRNPPASEKQVQGQAASLFGVGVEDTDGRAWPGSTEERIVDRDRPLFDLRKTFKSSGTLNPATLGELATDLEEKLEIETRRNAGAATATKSSTTTNTASGQGSSKTGIFGFRVKQPAPSPHANAWLDSSRSIHALSPPPANEARSTRPTEKTSQPQKSTTVSTEDSFLSKLCAAASSAPAQEAGLPATVSARSNYSAQCSQFDGQVHLSDGIVHRPPLRRSQRLRNRTSSDIPRTGPLVESKKFMTPSRQKTRVRTLEKDSTQSASMQETDIRGPQLSELQRLHGSDSSAPITNSSASYTLRLASPKIMVHRPDTISSEEDSHRHSSASSQIAPYMPLQKISTRPYPTVEDGDYFGSSSPIKEESDNEDDSFSHRSKSASPERKLGPISSALISSLLPETAGHFRSGSTALIRTPSPGPVDAVWKRVITKNREMMLPAFFYIVQAFCPDLTVQQIPSGYIYAFKAKDSRAKNYVRIGVTKDIIDRMKQHKRCYREYKLIYPLGGQDLIPVDHAHRVERLIHAELVEYAMKLEQCPGSDPKCHGHGEWFDVKEDHAIAVIQKWCHVISCSVYEQVPLPEKIERKKKKTGRGSLQASSPNDGKTNANSPDRTGGSPRPSNCQSPGLVAETKWRLIPLCLQDMMAICWPLHLRAPTADDEDVNGDGKGKALIEQ
ncbi:hypothetical protein EPUS_08458 [Endocarpon pusillum Z07020]|uniref:Bacteriophage T5 Orf172 DNA-binding domain-containing protein n=1 Tax=Endocarpon pusillum (strain Z07020 / HMAS-L-300199) TaxID=1263415 RepID=U1I4W5_ENDPU|nr:uncharacterized protein EPUS_08458 [Endocarpon pusillum Z07020]ERF77154.1 hypothetical protein EPUS_08458 [Endocarpon pusillum Z07020]